MRDMPTATRLHPWNTDFTWSDRPGPFRTLTAAQVAQFDAQGYVVLPSLVDDETLAQVARRDRPVRGRDGRLPGLGRRRAASRSPRRAPSRSPPTWWPGRRCCAPSACHPTIAGICADLVGPDVNLYWDQAVYKKPEKPRRFPWHQDNGYAFVEPQQYLTVWLALTDATLANGCPMVAPGFHRLGTIAHTYVDPLGWECLRDPDGAVAAEVPAGGAVVFSSLTPHLTGPNTTDAVRKAYILQYAPAGAEILRGDPHAGPPTGRDACDAPDRQYPVVVGGAPVSARR